MQRPKTLSEAFSGEYTKSDLEEIVGLTRGEADLWPKRGIISGHGGSPGSGKHRVYSFWNLVEASMAKGLSTGFKMQAGHIEALLQGVRDRLKERGIGTRGFPWESLFMGDWVIVFHGDEKPNVRLQYGHSDEVEFSPLVASASIGFVANRLLDPILEDEDEGRKGSQNWRVNALYARRARSMGAEDLQLPMRANMLTREKPDPTHPGSYNYTETLVIQKQNDKPISEEKWAKIKAFVKHQLNQE